VASRRRARAFAMQALYHADLCDQTAATSLNGLWSLLMDGEGVEGERPPESAEVEFATRLARGTLERRERMDELIEECSTNWRLVRMPVVLSLIHI